MSDEPVPGAAVPTREDAAIAFWHRFAPTHQIAWGELGSDEREGYLCMADCARELFASRPATDEAEALRIKLDDAERELLNERRAHEGYVADSVARIADLESQLAARPEPVMIDEALAERVCVLWYGRAWDSQPDEKAGDIESMVAALRGAFGDRASVSVQQGDDLPAPERERWRVTLATARSERDQLRAELEKTRAAYADVTASLDTCRAANDRGSAEYTRLREQHEALRAACVLTPEQRKAVGFMPHQHAPECAPLQYMQAYAERVQAALLKPAPAERVQVGFARAEEAEGLSGPDWPTVRAPIQHPPPESAMVEQVEATLEERVERLERQVTALIALDARRERREALVPHSQS